VAAAPVRRRRAGARRDDPGSRLRAGRVRTAGVAVFARVAGVDRVEPTHRAGGHLDRAPGGTGGRRPPPPDGSARRTGLRRDRGRPAPVVGHGVLRAARRRQPPGAGPAGKHPPRPGDRAGHRGRRVHDRARRPHRAAAAATQLVRRPPARHRRPVRFWSVAGAVTLPAAALVPFLPAAHLPHTTGVRLLCAVAAGLLAASVAASMGARACHACWGHQRGDRP
jgi:hypothetical protein